MLTLSELREVMRARRTSLLMDRERTVPRETIAEMCEVAQWAPNHKRTWPWRFALFTGDGRSRLGEAFASDVASRGVVNEQTLAKTATKFTRAPSILVIGSACDSDPRLDAENRYAVAAGIQNLLLAATSLGLASYWSSPPLIDSAGALRLCRFDADVALIGVIYLGWPRGEVTSPERPPLWLEHVT